MASDQQNNGLGLQVMIDRDTAGRLGITPQNIDDALYDAFGQRQVSTIYTQTNQYHVVLEVPPQCQKIGTLIDGCPIGSASANLATTMRWREPIRADRRGGPAAAPCDPWHEQPIPLPSPSTTRASSRW